MIRLFVALAIIGLGALLPSPITAAPTGTLTPAPAFGHVPVRRRSAYLRRNAPAKLAVPGNGSPASPTN